MSVHILSHIHFKPSLALCKLNRKMKLSDVLCFILFVYWLLLFVFFRGKYAFTFHSNCLRKSERNAKWCFLWKKKKQTKTIRSDRCCQLLYTLRMLKFGLSPLESLSWTCAKQGCALSKAEWFLKLFLRYAGSENHKKRWFF